MSVGNTNGHSMCDFKTLTADTMKGYLIVYFLKVNCCMKLIPLKKNTMSHHRGFFASTEVYVGLPSIIFWMLGERMVVLLLCLVVLADAKPSDTASNFVVYLQRRKGAFTGLSGSNIRSNPFRDLGVHPFQAVLNPHHQ